MHPCWQLVGMVETPVRSAIGTVHVLRGPMQSGRHRAGAPNRATTPSDASVAHQNPQLRARPAIPAQADRGRVPTFSGGSGVAAAAVHLIRADSYTYQPDPQNRKCEAGRSRSESKTEENKPEVVDGVGVCKRWAGGRHWAGDDRRGQASPWVTRKARTGMLHWKKKSQGKTWMAGRASGEPSNGSAGRCTTDM